MNRDELIDKLNTAGVRRDSYNLNGESVDEAYVVSRDSTDWIVYYSERGLRSGVRKFPTESAAFDDVYVRLCKDPTVRMTFPRD